MNHYIIVTLAFAVAACTSTNKLGARRLVDTGEPTQIKSMILIGKKP